MDYDEREFNKLVKENSKLISSIIKTLELEYGHFKVSSDDLYQEGLIALHEAYTKFNKDEGVKFSTFAYMVIKRNLKKFYFTCLKRYQNEYYSIDTIDLFDHTPLAGISLEAHDVGVKYNLEERNDRVDKRFIKLKQEDQHIVALRCLNNTYEEIADKLNITKKKVDSRLSRLKIRHKNLCIEGSY